MDNIIKQDCPRTVRPASGTFLAHFKLTKLKHHLNLKRAMPCYELQYKRFFLIFNGHISLRNSLEISRHEQQKLKRP